ncbi:MAG: hypothetical protein U5K51_10770 [Flavobacteriaceae bacterium]|nr:hypothetical protein [Flavobacteriaceae bacterium]
MTYSEVACIKFKRQKVVVLKCYWQKNGALIIWMGRLFDIRQINGSQIEEFGTANVLHPFAG